MQNITISEIAKIAGVSKTTVSRVINNRPDVREETRTRINELIREHDFSPNAFAKAISEQASHTIGVFTPHDENYIFSNPYYSEILRGISTEVNKHNYHLLLDYTKNDDVLPLIKQKRVDGIILLSPSSKHKAMIQKLKQLNVPLVSTSKIPGVTDVNYICIDDFKGAYIVTEYYISLGIKEILFINGPRTLASSMDRLAGYKSALNDHGIKYDSHLVINGDTSLESGYKIMQAALRNFSVRAVFAASDLMAVGAISAIAEAKMSVPDDIMVVGFDDIPLTDYLNPPLTTVRQPTYEKGRLATRMLLDLIAGKEIENIVMPIEMIIKGSTKESLL